MNIVELLLANGADVNIQSNDSEITLGAKENGYSAIVEILVKNGTVFEVRNGNGTTPAAGIEEVPVLTEESSEEDSVVGRIEDGEKVIIWA